MKTHDQKETQREADATSVRCSGDYAALIRRLESRAAEAEEACEKANNLAIWMRLNGKAKAFYEAANIIRESAA